VTGETENAPNALSVLNSVFGLPGFRGAQQEIVRHVTNGGNCLVLMPTGGGIEAILQHAHSLAPDARPLADWRKTVSRL
jgi:superfamily II DNA helicase RecQ